MLPGKKYSPEDLIKILKKRFWVIVLPWAIVAAGTAGFAHQLPDLYRSVATIQLIPAQVPEGIVRPVSTVKFADRLNATKQTILSRNRLELIIQEFDLYKEERKTMIMEEVVDKMRANITVGPRPGDTFAVQFVGRDRFEVFKVTEKLAGLFKEESSKEGERRAQGTSTFVDAAVEDSRRKLLDIENKRKDYIIRHSGEMPTQAGTNQQAIFTLQMNLNQLASAMNNDTTQKANLERMIESTEAQVEPAGAPSGMPDPTAPVGTVGEQLARAKAEMTRLREVRRLGEQNPEVRELNKTIASLTKLLEEEGRRPVPVGGAPVATMSAWEQARQSRLAGLRDDLEKINKNLANYQTEEKRIRAEMASYQTKLNNVPVREAELIDLTREYDQQSKQFANLLNTREASNLSVNLERRQGGEQFNLLDQARVPERPFSPNRLVINLIGILAGLTVGLGLVALLEYRDSTFKTDYEVSGLLALPVLAVVPLMRSAAEKKANFRKKMLLNVGLGSTVALCLAVLAYSFVNLR